jgi:hypothetical protein
MPVKQCGFLLLLKYFANDPAIDVVDLRSEILAFVSPQPRKRPNVHHI